MKLSYQEESIWIILVATLLVFGSYFFLAFKVFTSSVLPDFLLISLFVVTIVVYVILQIVLHAGLALAHVKEAEAEADKRDTLIELRVTRQTVHHIEAGKYSPSLELAFRISLVFKLPLENVFQYVPQSSSQD